ncbi:hypothetical protein EV356DRAFT_562653 [Viridothelium virens]|uniref:Disintegrin domain-containing protein n=1 Tax=Viridothelium virens TaxID=1048519 RepID=A0A6A6HP55_VIRVR|nr:hypothetical protein EV356DRAFT_562653 [Viridothelium virens]
MKGILITILALVAAPALAAEVDLSRVYKDTGSEFSGSLVARAVQEVKADEPAQLEARQNVQFCKLPPSVFVGNPGGAMPANLDGSCISLNACNAAGGEAFTGATGCNSGDCCIKRDCAGPNSNSACLQPNLAGDTLRPGQAGQFVNGACPTGLRCFQLTRGAL